MCYLQVRLHLKGCCDHYLFTGLSILKPPPVKWGLLLSWGRSSNCSTLVLDLCSLRRHTQHDTHVLLLTVAQCCWEKAACWRYLWSFFWLRYFFLTFASSPANLWFSLLYSFIFESSILSSAISTWEMILHTCTVKQCVVLYLWRLWLCIILYICIISHNHVWWRQWQSSSGVKYKNEETNGKDISA